METKTNRSEFTANCALATPSKNDAKIGRNFAKKLTPRKIEKKKNFLYKLFKTVL